VLLFTLAALLLSPQLDASRALASAAANASAPSYLETRIGASEIEGRDLVGALGTLSAEERSGYAASSGGSAAGEHLDVLVHNGIRSAAKRAAKRIWGAERRAHWRRVGLAELESASGRYSAQNVQRMLAGRAPCVKIRARIRKTGATRDLSVSMDLSHELLPQRVIGRWIPEVAQPYLHRRPNIKMRAPWEHALVDRYRKTGYDFIGTLEDLSVYSGK